MKEIKKRTEPPLSVSRFLQALPVCLLLILLSAQPVSSEPTNTEAQAFSPDRWVVVQEISAERHDTAIRVELKEGITREQAIKAFADFLRATAPDPRRKTNPPHPTLALQKTRLREECALIVSQLSGLPFSLEDAETPAAREGKIARLVRTIENPTR